MSEHGFQPVHIVLQLDPPWTTDWMSQEARERLRCTASARPRGTPAMRTCPLR